MAYAGFDDKGYEFFTEGKYVLFSSDTTHNYLFDYILIELEELYELFQKYISNRMDTTTFDLKDCQNDNDEIDKIIERLKLIHPYFEHQYEEDIINKVGNYFNELLVYTIFHQNKTIENEAIKKKWYFTRLQKLVPPSFWNDDIGNNFYNKFLGWIGMDNEWEEVLVDNVPNKKPIIFCDEIRTQKNISNMLYFILDISAPDIGRLKTNQRVWLYGNIFNGVGPVMGTTQNLLFVPPIHFRGGQDRSQEAEYHNRMYDIFTPLHALRGLNIERDGIPADITEYYKSAIEYASAVTEAKVYKEYKINCLQDLLYLEIITMIQSGTMIRKCKNCGKYFVVNNRRIAYCDRIDESGNLCSAVGPSQSYQRKINDEEALKLYNRAYKTHHARVRNGILSKEGLSSWCSKAKGKLEEVRAGKLDIASFQEWLKD